MPKIDTQPMATAVKLREENMGNTPHCMRWPGSKCGLVQASLAKQLLKHTGRSECQNSVCRLESSVQDDHPAQILRTVRIQSLLGAGKQPKQLSRYKERRRQSQIRDLSAKFEQKIAGTAHHFICPIADGSRRCA